MKQRETFKSRLGFLLLSAGCAIGIGNVWRFPYVVGQNGGGAFVLFYVLFLAIMGVPVLSMEFAVGRASRKSPVKAYQQLEPKGMASSRLCCAVWKLCSDDVLYHCCRMDDVLFLQLFDWQVYGNDLRNGERIFW